MSDLDLLLSAALDTQVPLRVDRRPAWGDVLVRAGATHRPASVSRRPAGRVRRPRRRRLVLALAIIAISVVVIGSALAALGSYPFGRSYPFRGITTWLGFTAGPSARHAEVYVARPSGAADAIGRGALLSWSPDGSRLLVSGDGGMYVVRADGSSAVRVAPKLGFPSAARWSPDGRTIAYDHRGALFVVDGSGPRLLAKRLSVAWNGGWSWSPSGRQIVYAGSDAEGRSGVFLVNTDGSPKPAAVTIRPRPSKPTGTRQDHAPSYGAATWSPTGSRIAFQWDDGRWACCVEPWIYVMRPDGTQVTRLARGSIAAWSPAGDKLAITHGFNRNTALFVLDAYGSGLRRLYCRWGCDQPTWFPDGSKLAYRAHDGTEIIIVRADGSYRRSLIAGVHSGEGAFAISPNGSTVAYVGGHRRDRGHYLYLVGADGTGRRLIAHSTTSRFKQPIWRPARPRSK